VQALADHRSIGIDHFAGRELVSGAEDHGSFHKVSAIAKSLRWRRCIARKHIIEDSSAAARKRAGAREYSCNIRKPEQDKSGEDCGWSNGEGFLIVENCGGPARDRPERRAAGR
jgi:hypothetical protein